MLPLQWAQATFQTTCRLEVGRRTPPGQFSAVYQSNPWAYQLSFQASNQFTSLTLQHSGQSFRQCLRQHSSTQTPPLAPPSLNTPKPTAAKQHPEHKHTTSLPSTDFIGPQSAFKAPQEQHNTRISSLQSTDTGSATIPTATTITTHTRHTASSIPISNTHAATLQADIKHRVTNNTRLNTTSSASNHWRNHTTISTQTETGSICTHFHIAYAQQIVETFILSIDALAYRASSIGDRSQPHASQHQPPNSSKHQPQANHQPTTSQPPPPPSAPKPTQRTNYQALLSIPEVVLSPWM